MDKKMAMDWPYLNKYKKDNEALGLPKPNEKRIVFMGDSITEFWSNLSPSFFAGKPFINRGISGQTSPQMLIRFRADVVDLKPTAVIILAGANDLAENTGPSTLKMITDNIFSMVELAKAHHIKIILCSVLPADDFPWRKGLQPATKIIELNEMIQNYTNVNQIPYIDYYSAMVNEQKGMKSSYTDDGVHPNKAGYEAMNPLAEAVITKVLSAEY